MIARTDSSIKEEDIKMSPLGISRSQLKPNGLDLVKYLKNHRALFAPPDGMLFEITIFIF
jgi:hypothetical protein